MSGNDHQHSVDADVPVNVAYNQWTQFATLPEFIESRHTPTGAWRGTIEQN